MRNSPVRYSKIGEGSATGWRRKARCASPARFFETTRLQRRVFEGGDGGRAHGAMGAEQWARGEEDDEVTPGPYL